MNTHTHTDAHSVYRWIAHAAYIMVTRRKKCFGRSENMDPTQFTLSFVPEL